MTSSSPLSAYTLFLDRNFGRFQVAEALRKAGFTVEVHQDHFPEADAGEESDEQWIREVTARGWVILTRNGKIRSNPLERRTFIECGARVFNIRNGSANAAQVAGCIQRASIRMARILGSDPGPYIVGISLNGDISFLDKPNG